MKTKYVVTTSHNTMASLTGNFEITVTVNFGGETRYANGAVFGCRRDYRVTTDEEAVRMLLAEHACQLVRIHKAK